MDTPICDFVRRYADSRTLRLHMPGHKGVSLLGMEHLDITEIRGADSLYEAEGIIRQSEKNASQLFGCDTYYSTEGSSLCIRAMLYLVAQNAGRAGERVPVLAGRNAHKTFLSACALLDLDVQWLCPGENASYLSCAITAGEVERAILETKPAAVYLTSPDYLGNTVDVAAIAAVCHRQGVLLLVDNAHGAYLKFLNPSRHPMDLGADLCCDSAHKTLPALTGAAYLHVSAQLPERYHSGAKNALAMFGSTSPSYLILQSLDAVNGYLSAGYPERLNAFTEIVYQCKQKLFARGYTFRGDEPLKVTISTKPYGCTGEKMADMLREAGIECEFADPDFLVLMLTPEIGEEGLARLERALLAIEKRPAIQDASPVFRPQARVMGVREAAFARSEVVPAKESAGRVLAAATVGCPPAVPIVICGERIDRHAVACFAYYGIDSCTVVEE